VPRPMHLTRQRQDQSPIGSSSITRLAFHPGGESTSFSGMPMKADQNRTRVGPGEAKHEKSSECRLGHRVDLGCHRAQGDFGTSNPLATTRPLRETAGLARSLLVGAMSRVRTCAPVPKGPNPWQASPSRTRRTSAWNRLRARDMISTRARHKMPRNDGNRRETRFDL
jgi:hypothetical protein